MCKDLKLALAEVTVTPPWRRKSLAVKRWDQGAAQSLNSNTDPDESTKDSHRCDCHRRWFAAFDRTVVLEEYQEMHPPNNRRRNTNTKLCC